MNQKKECVKTRGQPVWAGWLVECPVCEAEVPLKADAKGRPYLYCPACGARVFFTGDRAREIVLDFARKRPRRW